MVRRRYRASLKELAIIVLLILALAWLLWLLWGIIEKEERARSAANEARQELTALESRQKTLEENIAELNTSRGEEAALREAYGVARPGEEVIIVVPDPEGDQRKPLSWWRQFLGWFGL